MAERLEEYEDVPEGDNVARYCRPRNIQNGEITSAEFELRPNEYYLSVNWLEYFGNQTDINSKLSSVRSEMEQNGFSIKKTGLFAVINVAEAKSRIRDLFIKKIPEKSNPSHAGIASGREDENRGLTLELSKIVEDNTYPIPEK